MDLVLVAGDQFDGAVPSPESERIVYGTLLKLAQTGARVVVISGNHDNPRKLAALDPLLEIAGVTVASEVRRPNEGGVKRITTRSDEKAVIALLPFLSKRKVVRAQALMEEDADRHQVEYADRCRRIVERLCEPFGDDTVNLVVAHLTVLGARAGGGERGAHILDYYVPATIFPSNAHYVALGHLHGSQSVPFGVPVRYSGPPFALDFGEKQEEHSVLIVDVEAGSGAKVRRVPITGGRRLRTIRGSRAELEVQAGTTGDDYLRVFVEEALAPGGADDIRDLFPNAVDVIVRPHEKSEGREPSPPPPPDGDPATLFDKYLEERNIPSTELSRFFKELLESHYEGEL